MNDHRLLSLMLGGLLFALSLSASGETSDKPIASPLRLEPSEMAYADMDTDFPPWPQESIISGVSEHRYKTLYSGDIDVEIYESKPLVLRVTDFPIDEFVIVISGTLILTTQGGSPQKFDVGDSVLVPKGFTGTWEMQGDFREMIVIMNETTGSQQ